MERLTERRGDGDVRVKEHDYVSAAHRLADYEDTGLTPEEVNKVRMDQDNRSMRSIARTYGIDVERLKELARADREGRVVALPCKVGDTVWVNSAKRTVQVTIDEAYFDDDQKGLRYLVSFACDLNCDGCPFADWHQGIEGEHYCNGEYGQASIMGPDLGKTVFLAREEAEEALRRGENA